jgi:hypothetical protein
MVGNTGPVAIGGETGLDTKGVTGVDTQAERGVETGVATGGKSGGAIGVPPPLAQQTSKAFISKGEG